MAQLAQHDLDEIYAFAVDLGKRAGKLLLDGIDKRVGGVDVLGSWPSPRKTMLWIL